MEIIHIALGKVNPQRMNGVNKVVYNLATEQSRAGLSVSVWGISASTVHDYPERNFTTVLFEKKKSPFAIPEGFLEAVRGTSPETVFHLHGGFIPVFYSIARILQAENRRFIFTPHGSYNRIAWRKSKLAKMVYFRLFERKMLQRSAVVHVLGKSESEGLNYLLKGLNVQRVPYGFELGESFPVTPNARNEDYIIGFCGRIDVYTKGLDVLLEAFGRFITENGDAILWIIGDGPERPTLEAKAASLGITEKVKFWGSKYGQEKDDLLAKLQLFVHPSRNEGLPTAVLEAASFGIPCLVSEATNLGDEIRKSEAGVVIAHTTTNEMLEGLRSAYAAFEVQSPEEMKIRSRSMVADFFNWSVILRDFNSIYQRALA